ncbi:MAG: hypothetical protein ACPG8A_12195 [Psychrobium sp.]
MADWEQEHQEATQGPTEAAVSAKGPVTLDSYEFKFGEYLSKGWSVFAKNMGGFIGFTVVMLLISVVLSLIPIIGQIANIVISAPLMAGYYVVARKVMNGEETSFGDFFGGFDHFLPLFLAYLVSSIFIMIGMFLLLIPGIYLAIGYMFTSLMVINRDLGFFEAMEMSRKLITKKWFAFFGFALVIMIINIIGVMLLGLGLLFTLPFTICAIAVAYDDIVNKQLA